jgi:hypothetical protein
LGVPVAVALKLTTAVHNPASADTLILAGQVMTGGIHDCVTLIVWLHVAVFPYISVTVHVTTVVPIGYGPGLFTDTVATPQLSPVTGVPMEPVDVV